MSDSGDIPIKIEVVGLGTLEGVIFRHIAPISADAILAKMPFVLRGRFPFGSKNYWTLITVGIKKGPNSSAKKDVIRGDIIYNPKADEISIILEDHEMPNKINHIGKITGNLELLNSARNGLNNKISRA